MNTSGMLRGYMAKNMKAEDFMQVVVKAFSREFKEDRNRSQYVRYCFGNHL